MELYVRRSILAAVYIDGASPPLALMCRTSLSAKVPLRENGFDFFSLKLLWLLFIARPLDLDCGIGENHSGQSEVRNVIRAYSPANNYYYRADVS
jgi:hypothetical protein